jgi:transcriptional regulator GlxA family with amidase domain
MSDGSIIATVCAGAMLVASAGLMKGRNAVTHHMAIEELRTAGANVVEARVVDDGNLISSGGVTSGLDLSLWVLERFYGSDLVLKIERGIEHERRGVTWRAANAKPKPPQVCVS